MNIADLLHILKWWGVFLIFGITFLPLTSRIFSSFIDKGYIFSKVLGIVLVSYIVFLLGSFKLVNFSQLNILIIFLALGILNIFLLVKSKPEIGNKNLKLFIVEEFIFLTALILWSVIRMYSPSIHDLEKFMDFGFINSILRSEYFPARDMWLTPHSINYYYFGHLITAVVTKASGIPSFITYNLMISTLFAITVSASLSIGINMLSRVKEISVKKSLLLGLVFSYFMAFAGNLQTIYSFFKSFTGEMAPPFWKLIFDLSNFPNSYWYPSATRFIYRTIHEFPSYSFIVSDLHGHVLDIMIVLFLIALLMVFFFEKKVRFFLIPLLSLFLAVAYMTNAWDGLIYLGLSINILFISTLLRVEEKVISKKVAEAIFQSAKSVIPLMVFFFLFTFVFNKDFAPFASGIGLNCSPQFLTNIGNLGPFVFEAGQCERTPIWQLFILYGFFAYCILGLSVFLWKARSVSKIDYFVILISLFSFLLIIIPEFFYLRDIYTTYFRANTMFKLAYQAYILLTFASAYSIIRILFSGKNKFSIGFLILSLPLIFLISIYPYFSVLSAYGGLKQIKNLNGIEYLRDSHRGDYEAIMYLNQNVKGQPVILEAQGDSYTDFARVSANTGLPTVLGWTVHEWLWRGSYDVPSSRFGDISTMYESNSVEETKKILDKYNVALVFVGRLELEKYKVNENKFLEIGELIYSDLDTRIYKVR